MMLPFAQSLLPSFICFAFGNEKFKIKSFIFHVNSSMRIESTEIYSRYLHEVVERHPFLPAISITSSSTSITVQSLNHSGNTNTTVPIAIQFASFHSLVVYFMSCVLGLGLSDWLDKTLE